MTLVKTLTKLRRFFLTLAFSSLIGFCAVAGAKCRGVAGPECGGGGNGVLIGSEFVLLDLLNFPNITDIYKTTKRIRPELNRVSANTSLAEFNQMARITLEKAGYNLKLSQELLSQGSSLEISVFESEFLMPVFTAQELQVTNYYLPPFLAEAATVYQLAFYSPIPNQVAISQVIWSRMGPVNRLALMIHENLRFFQNQNQIFFSERELQNLTVALLVCPANKQINEIMAARDTEENRVAKLQQKTVNCLVQSDKF